MSAPRVPSRFASALIAGLIVLSGTVRAGDGRREINQTLVLASGGFPYVIASPGSYVLTGDLAPPANVIGIRVDADDVNLDLNGFAIRGGLVCVPQSCSGTGPSAGVSVPTSPTTNGRRCSVRNGSIAGIAGSAVVLRDEAFVDALSVSNTFFHGIILGARSLATRNRITAVGRSGLFLGAGSGYGQNVIASTGQFFAFGSVFGGKPIGGNVCDDGRCPGARRFYLTTGSFMGNQALTACEAGFHMASRWELQQVSTLRYDAVRGYTHGGIHDQLPGPPSNHEGWIRVGMVSNLSETVGVANCQAWQSQDFSDDGTTANLTVQDPTPEGSFTLSLSVCASLNRVWCVEDD